MADLAASSSAHLLQKVGLIFNRAIPSAMEVIGTSLNRELLLRLCKRFGSIEAATCENLFKKLDQAT